FSPSVKAVQERRGSRGTYARLEQNGGWETKIDAVLVKFIAGLRSFYLATASKDGAALRPAPRRTAGLFARHRRDDARFRRFRRQPAICQHRQSRRERARHALPHGLPESPTGEGLGPSPRGRERPSVDRASVSGRP